MNVAVATARHGSDSFPRHLTLHTLHTRKHCIFKLQMKSPCREGSRWWDHSRGRIKNNFTEQINVLGFCFLVLFCLFIFVRRFHRVFFTLVILLPWSSTSCSYKPSNHLALEVSSLLLRIWLLALPTPFLPLWPPTLFLQSIHPSPKLLSFYYVHVPLTFLSLESITSPWGIFPPEEKQPSFCLVIWIYVCLNGVSCSSDSPPSYYAGEDDLELLTLRPLPPVTAGITGLPYPCQSQHLVWSSFFYSLAWHRRSLSPRGMLGTLFFPGLISTVSNMQ